MPFKYMAITRERIPRDGNNIAAQLTPSSVALARTVSSSISASTTVTFNASTTFLRVYAVNQDVYLKWGTTAVTAANFDEVIPAGQICDFFVPFLSTGVIASACTVIERQATATIIVCEK